MRSYFTLEQEVLLIVSAPIQRVAIGSSWSVASLSPDELLSARIDADPDDELAGIVDVHRDGFEDVAVD